MELRQRKKNRLEGYDYGRAGCYFITVCAGKRAELFGKIAARQTDGVGRDDLGAPLVQLSAYGKIVDKHICSISSAYPNVAVDQYVIMPNHIHLILRVSKSERGAPGSSRPTQLIPRVIAVLKRFSNQEAGFNLWQISYHDHIIRNDADYRRIWEYIDNNPAKWREDCYYTEYTEETP